MCHFITATLPHNADADSIAPMFESHRLAFKLVSNPHVSQQLETEDLYVLTTKGHCDCGTALGSLNVSTARDAPTYDRELNKFRKQGWSEAKIKRWLEQKEQTKEKHQREDEANAQRGAGELNQWMSLIGEVLKSGHAGRIGLMLHMYEGLIESERIKILRRQKVKLAELSAELLIGIEEDVLYEFER